MSYVERDDQNNIVALYFRPQRGKALRFLPDDDADVIAFINRTSPSPAPEPIDVDAELASDKVLGALATALSIRFSITKAAMIDEIKLHLS